MMMSTRCCGREIVYGKGGAYARVTTTMLGICGMQVRKYRIALRCRGKYAEGLKVGMPSLKRASCFSLSLCRKKY